MLDVLSDTYRIATRMDGFDQMRTDRPAPRGIPVIRHRRAVRAPWLVRAVKAVARWYARRLQRARDREAVLRMTDHQLKDIGATRFDLLRSIDTDR